MNQPHCDGSKTMLNGNFKHDASRQECANGSSHIAITGMSCRFAGNVTDPSKLWQLIESGRNAWSPIPHARFDSKSLYHPEQQKRGRHHVKGGYFLDQDVTAFDAAFFQLSADAASAMDPQLRLLMEAVYEASEDAGIPVERLSGSNTAVYSAAFGRDYANRLSKDPEALPASFITGNEAAMMSNRISHFFNLTGPSATISTGCSGSLTALHLAVQSLQMRESDTAIVAASNLLLDPDFFIALSDLGVLGRDGRSYSWDHRASGYGRGEGVAVLIIKPLKSAQQDRDFVHAIIRASAMNQDGKTGTITSPSKDAQVKLIRDCYQRAQLDLSQTGYIEAHMTGTLVGDPTEAQAIAETFGKAKSTCHPVLVGSIKSNIGHTEPVSGLASVIKTAIMLQKSRIPPNANYEKINPGIPLKEWNLQVPTCVTDWPKSTIRQASINNFGYGGTNVHVIMQAYSELSTHRSTGLTNGISGVSTARNCPQTTLPSLVYVLSAKSTEVTNTMGRNLASYIRLSHPNERAIQVTNLAYTLASRRSQFSSRVAIKASNLDDLCESLENSHLKSVRAMASPPRIGFVFNGQGAQWYAMGRELISTYPIFQGAVLLADRVLQEYGACWSLSEELSRDEKSSRVHDTEFGQPITVALQLCLVDLLDSWKITPSAVVSHSSGEIAAAYAAGILTFKEAIGVAYYRGKLASKHQKSSPVSGSMLVARINAQGAEEYLLGFPCGKVTIACINSPNSVTLSGDSDVLGQIATAFEDDGIMAKKLLVPVAYHSHHMQYMAQDYLQKLQEILPSTSRSSRIPFASPVTGGNITAQYSLNAHHWVQNLVSPVLFSQALQSMVFGTEITGSTQVTNVDILLEVGAHDTLIGPTKQILMDKHLPHLSCLKRFVDAVSTMQTVACELWTRGYPLALSEVNRIIDTEATYIQGLPSYPWDHSMQYVVEPRVSKNHRYKSIPPHEFLGSLVAGCDILAPTWRNILSIQDIPWLADHQLDSRVVLPGAGYVTMAIEAMRLRETALSNINAIAGYQLQDVDIMNALVFPDTLAVVETIFSLNPCSEKDLDHKGWFDFTLSSVAADGVWTQHAKGRITAQMRMKYPSISLADFLGTQNPLRHVEPECVYSTMRKMDFYHGPAFQNLVGTTVAGARSTTHFALHSGTAEENCEYVLHPTTLDSIFQSCYACLPDEAKEGFVLLPRAIGRMFVPQPAVGGNIHEMRALVELLRWGQRSAVYDCTVLFNVDKSEDIVCQLKDFQLQRLAGQHNNEDQTDIAKVHSKCQWVADGIKNIPTSLKETMRIDLTNDQVEFERSIRMMAYHMICSTVSQLKDDNRSAWQSHHQKFYDWMVRMASKSHKQWPEISKSEATVLIKNLKMKNAAGELMERVGNRLADIIRGKITPLEIMMEGNLLQRYYQDLPSLKDRACKQLRSIIEVYATKNPGAKVLEIGAGTGGATLSVLEGFGARGNGCGTLLGHYDFTDVSSGFFAAGKERFEAWDGLLTFKRLDIENDPAQQGFTNDYDLIVAAQVIHATKNLNTTLMNVRSLLKSGGQLILIETTQDALDIQLIFGTLPGWWLSEEPHRDSSPNIDIRRWDETLKAADFSGVEFSIGDCEQTDLQVMSTIVATANAKAQYPPSITIVHGATTPREWLRQLVQAVDTRTGSKPTLAKFDDFRPAADQLVIMTSDAELCLLQGMGADRFDKVKAILLGSLGVLWLSWGASIAEANPLCGQTQGLLRTLRREDLSKRLVHFSFDMPSTNWDNQAVEHVVMVLVASFNYATPTANIEWEYALKDGTIHVPRLFPDPVMDRACSKLESEPVLRSFHSDGRNLTWEPPEDGILDEMHFKEQTIDVGNVPNGMVEVEAAAFGLNFRDVMVAVGVLKDTEFVAHEGAGVVKRLGPGTDFSGLQIGDRVCGVFKGDFSNISLARWTSVAKIPVEMSWEEAASLPYAYGTAYLGLKMVANLQRGETVLIHSAAGGVGQAAVMLAQQLGAEVYATCGTAAKERLLTERYGIPGDHIFSSRDEDFATKLMVATKQRGVDVVLNSLAGPLLLATWRCMAIFGRFVEIGKNDIEAARSLDMSPFRRGVTMACIDLIQYSELKGSVMHAALMDIMSLLKDRIIQIVHPIRSHPVSEMAQVMKHMQKGVHMGKLVLSLQTNNLVKVKPQRQPLRLESTDETFLIVGGLGGIGREITVWMMAQGAKSLLVLSRKASSHPKAHELLEKAREYDCRLSIENCDITEESALKEMADRIAIPPVRGIIQAAMILDDTVFERMTYDQWLQATRPKVDGTLNLLKQFPDPRFFIMLSSGTGIFGNVSQANYTAGGTFQDALARNRAANGLPAVTIDLGQVSDVGWVAEGGVRVQGRLESTLNTTSIPVVHVLQLVENAIRNPIRESADDSQIITCIFNYSSFASDQAIARDKRFGTLRLGDTAEMSKNNATGAGASKTDNLIQQLKNTKQDLAKAFNLTLALVVAKVAGMFSLDPEDFDVNQTLSYFGMDSLVAVQLRNWLSSAVKAKVSIFEILQTRSIVEFAKLILARSSIVGTTV